MAPSGEPNAWKALGELSTVGFALVVATVIGLAGAFALTRFLSTLLFGIGPTDPITFGAVSLLLGTIAFLACLIPARRAAKVHPMEALRYE